MNATISIKNECRTGSDSVIGQAVRGSPWLTLSSMGIGTYLGSADDETDEQVTCAIILSVMHAM